MPIEFDRLNSYYIRVLMVIGLGWSMVASETGNESGTYERWISPRVEIPTILRAVLVFHCDELIIQSFLKTSP
jgi:hypothetical protein